MKAEPRPKPLSLTGLIATQIAIVVIAFGLASIFEIPLLETARLDLVGIGGGIAGGMALIVVVGLIDRIWPEFWASLLRQVAEMFRPVGDRLTLPVILLISALAGIGEEMLLRGAQLWLADYLGHVAGIAISALAFGLMHPLSRAYVFVAAAIGALLGLIFLATGNIIAPILAHAIYDVRAFIRLRRIIAQLPTVDRAYS